MTYLLMIVGLVLLLVGANYLVDSSVVIAKRAKISDFVIGLTIVGMGTSSPELFVSVSSAIQGMGDVSLGNVVGSNICNMMLILGGTALIMPVAMDRSNIRRDIPITIVVSVLLTVLCYIGLLFGDTQLQVSRVGGVVLLIGLVAFMVYALRSGKIDSDASYEEPDGNKLSKLPVFALVFIAIASLALLVYGGDLFVDATVSVAKAIGLSDFVISTTIIAVGTSLPELITCVVAARKGNSEIALGNVLGSNIFNILFILGVSATISPLTLSGVNIVDFGVMIVSSIMAFVFAYTMKKCLIDRTEGAIFMLGYVAYVVYLLYR